VRIPLNNNKRPSSVVGLNLGDDHWCAKCVARVKDAAIPRQSAAGALALDLDQPERAGDAIRKALDTAGIRESRCVVALPPSWIMSLSTSVPELSPEDLSGLLGLEAEKGFPCDPSQLQIARVPSQAGGAKVVTQFAVRKQHLDYVGAVMKAARLKPVSFTVGLAALPAMTASPKEGRVVVATETSGATIAVAAGGGISAFRTGETAAIVRDLRITAGQLPPELQPGIRSLALVGDEKSVAAVIDEVSRWAAGAGLSVVRQGPENVPIGDQIAETIAARWTGGADPAVEFLPPQPHRFSALVARYSSRRFATAGLAAAGVAAALIACFGWQEYRRWSLRLRWRTMQDQVAKLEGLQGRIRDYRPWYDTSFHDLTVLRRIAECFPENGTVTAKTIEIRGSSGVTISGTAKDNTSLLRTLDQLRRAKEIRSLTVEHIQGKVPEQFTLSFRWTQDRG